MGEVNAVELWCENFSKYHSRDPCLAMKVCVHVEV